jgi:hypothetical protein
LGGLVFVCLYGSHQIDVDVSVVSVDFLSDVVLESVVLFLYPLVAVESGLVLPVLEIDKAGLELLFVSEFAFDEFGVGTDDVFYLLFQFAAFLVIDPFLIPLADVDTVESLQISPQRLYLNQIIDVAIIDFHLLDFIDEGGVF